MQILDAPDLDHDGVRDLVTTSFFMGRYLTTEHNGTPPIPERVYVDALSGKDGHPLWWWHHDHPTDRRVQHLAGSMVGARARRLAAAGRSDRWRASADGYSTIDVPPIVQNLEASTGRAVATAVGLSQGRRGRPGRRRPGRSLGRGRRTASGVPRRDARSLASSRLVHAANETSRPATGIVQPAADLDGDGIADTLIAGPWLRRTSRRPMRSPVAPWDRFLTRVSRQWVLRRVVRQAAAPRSPARAATDTRSGRRSSIPAGSGSHGITAKLII